MGARHGARGASRASQDKIVALAEANVKLEKAVSAQKEQAGRLQAEFDPLQKVLAGLDRTGGAGLTLNGATGVGQ